MNQAPRVTLGSFPTPLEPAPDLGDVLGVRQVWVKRDDLTGYSWGGNKVRAIEFLLGDAIGEGADTIIVCGGPTSNFAALMAVAGLHHGLGVHHISYGSRPAHPPAALAVSLQSGAYLEFTGSPDRAGMDAAALACAQRLRARGKRPYVVPRGGATPIGALGFATAALELAQQLKLIGLDRVSVVLPVGSGGSIAGLVAGWTSALAPLPEAPSLDVEIVGVSVSRSPEDLHDAIGAIAAACGLQAGGGLLEATSVRCRWSLVDGRGAGFGVSDGSKDAMGDEIARRTRFLADPTYNLKALSWLGGSPCRFSGPIVYWHTGGALGVVDRLFNQHASQATL